MHLVLFQFVCPGERDAIPAWVMEELMTRVRGEQTAPAGNGHAANDKVCQGTLLSRAQYLVDVEHWGYADARLTGSFLTEADIDLWTEAIDHERPTPATRPTVRVE